MYEYIRGIFKGINKEYIIVENNGIGYKIFTSGSTMSKMPKKDEEVKLYIEQIVRQDFIGLYGFLSKEELNMFNLLLTITGVGAKAALSLLSISNVNNLKLGILNKDTNLLTRAPGIGKKIAQRIILELKDKLDMEEIIEENFYEDVNLDIAKKEKEVIEALVSLGYTEKEAKKAIKNVEKNDSIENIIKSCFKNLMN